MNWIIEHLQIVLAIAGAVAYWLNQRRAAEAEKDAPEDQTTQAQPASMAEADDQMRAEQVREAIRRKIAARRAGIPDTEPAERGSPEPVEERKFELPPLMRPRPVSPLDPFGGPRPASRRDEPEREVEQPAAPPPVLAAETLEASLERQEQLAAKLREYEEQKAVAARRAAAIKAAAAEEAAREPAVVGLQEELRDPKSLRRAVILREVLGTPVGLR